MSTGRDQRPAKRRAPESPHVHPIQTRKSRRQRHYQLRFSTRDNSSAGDSPDLGSEKSAAHEVDRTDEEQLSVMVVASGSSAEHRDIPIMGGRPQSGPYRMKSADRLRRCAKLKKLDVHRNKALDVQRALIADADGDRPLHLAVVHRDGVLVRQLCAMLHSVGAPLDSCNFMRQTPLHLAVILRDALLVEVLLEEGCSLSPRDNRGNTPLHLASRHSDSQCLQTILRSATEEAATVIDERNFEGKTCLHIATSESNVETVRTLAKAGCNLNIGEGKSGRTALTNAVYARDRPLVRALLQCGASPDVQDYAGTSSYTAASETDDSIADILATGTLKTSIVNSASCR